MNLYQDESVYNIMVKYISDFENQRKDFSWSEIISKYIKFNNLE